jgi:uncharacterized protein
LNQFFRLVIKVKYTVWKSTERKMQTFKVFVAGITNAGKTSFVWDLSEIDVVSTEGPGLTTQYSVAFDFGRLTLWDDMVLYFFANPGARSPEKMLTEFQENILKPPIGVVMMVDSRLPSSMWGASDAGNRSLFQALQKYNLPLILALSRQDQRDARSIDEIRKALSIPDDIKVVRATDVFQRNTAKKVLFELFKCFPQNELIGQIIEKLHEQLQRPQYAVGLMVVSHGYNDFSSYEFDRKITPWVFNGQHIPLESKRLNIDSQYNLYYLTPDGLMDTDDADYNWLTNPRFTTDLSVLLEQHENTVIAPVPYVIVLRDAQNMQKTKARIEQCRAVGTPCFVLLSLREQGVSVEQAYDELQLPVDFPIIPYQSNDNTSKREALIKILDHLPNNAHLDHVKTVLRKQN